jgi:autotransporter-associated beta strand protein
VKAALLAATSLSVFSQPARADVLSHSGDFTWDANDASAIWVGSGGGSAAWGVGGPHQAVLAGGVVSLSGEIVLTGLLSDIDPGLRVSDAGTVIDTGAGYFSGTGGIVFGNGGTIRGGGQSTYDGGTLVSGGTLTLGGTGQAAPLSGGVLGSGAVTLAAGATLNIAAAAAGNLSNFFFNNDIVSTGDNTSLAISAQHGTTTQKDNVRLGGSVVLRGDILLKGNGADVASFTLGGDTTVGGKLRVENATLQIGNGGNGGSLAFTGPDGIELAAGSKAIFDRSNTVGGAPESISLGAAISGDGIFIKRGESALTLDGVLSTTKGLAVEKGSLTLTRAVGGAFGGDSGSIRVTGVTSRLELAQASALAGALGVPVSVEAGGTLAAQDYNPVGALALDSGNLLVARGGSAGNAQSFALGSTVNVSATGGSPSDIKDSFISVAAGVVSNHGVHLSETGTTFNVAANARLTIAVPLLNAGSTGNAARLVKTGEGWLVLNGDSSNGFSGGVTLAAGVLVLNSPRALNANGVAHAVTGESTLVLQTSGNYGAPWNIGANLSVKNTDPATLSGKLTGSGVLVKEGTGSLVLAHAENTNAGLGVKIREGTLEIADRNALGSGPLTLDGGTLLLSGLEPQKDFSFQINPVTVTRDSRLHVESGLSRTFIGTMGNGGTQASLEKTGSGKLVFKGVSSVPSLNISAGQFIVSGAGVAWNGSVTVANDTTFGVTDGATANNVTVRNGGTFVSGPGNVARLELGGGTGLSPVILPEVAGVTQVAELAGTAAGLMLDPSLLVSKFEEAIASGTPIPILDYGTNGLSTAPAWGIKNEDIYRPDLSVADTGTGYVLNVTGQMYAVLVWNGTAVNRSWDTTSRIWKNTGKSDAPDRFLQGDEVVFDATSAAAGHEINIPGAVSPRSVKVDTPDENLGYVFTSTSGGKITGGTTLVKTGPGSLIIKNSNDYTASGTWGTEIRGGTVRAETENALGAAPILIRNEEPSQPIYLTYETVGKGNVPNKIEAEGGNVYVNVQRDIPSGISFAGENNFLYLHSGAAGSTVAALTPIAVGEGGRLTLSLPSGSVYTGRLTGKGELTLAIPLDPNNERSLRIEPGEACDFQGTFVATAGTYRFAGASADWGGATLATAGTATPTIRFEGTGASDGQIVKIKELRLASGNLAVEGEAFKPYASHQPILDIVGGKITHIETGSASTSDKWRDIRLDGYATSSAGTLTIDTSAATTATTWGAFTLVGQGVIQFSYDDATSTVTAAPGGSISPVNLVKKGSGTLFLTGGSIPDALNPNAIFTIEDGLVQIGADAQYGKTICIQNAGSRLRVSGSHDKPVSERTFILDGGALELNSFWATETPVSTMQNIQIQGAGTGAGVGRLELDRASLPLGSGSRVFLDGNSTISLKDSTLRHLTPYSAGVEAWTGNEAALEMDSPSKLDLRGNSVTIGKLTGSGEIRNSAANTVATRTLTIGNGTVEGDVSLSSAHINSQNTNQTSNTPEGQSSGGTYVLTAAGPVDLVKTGGGKQILTGLVTSEKVAIDGGVLQFGDVQTSPQYQPAGTGTLSIAAPAKGVFFAPFAASSSVNISGAGSVEKDGAGVLTISGAAQTYGGATLVKAGTLSFANAASLYQATDAGAKIEIASGGVLKIQESGTIRLGSGQTSHAGHSQTLQGAPEYDIVGNVELSGGHVLQVGGTHDSHPADFSTLRIKGNLTIAPSAATTIRLDVATPGDHDEIALSGELRIQSGSTPRLELGTPGGILLPRSADSNGTFYPLIAAVNLTDGTSFNASFGAAPDDAFAGIGLAGSPSLKSNLVVRDGKLGVVVERNGRQFIWDGTGASDSWDAGSANWIWDDSSGTLSSASFVEYGAAVLREGTGAAEIDIAQNVRPLTVVVEDSASSAPNPAATFTLTNRAGARITGGGGIEKNSAGTLILKAGNDTNTPNDFTGPVYVLGGKLHLDNTGNAAIPLIADKGLPSLLGAGSLASDLNLGNGAALQFNSSQPTSTNRSFTVDAGGGKIENLGAGQLQFTGTEEIRIGGTGSFANDVRTLEIAATQGDVRLGLSIGAQNLRLLKTGDGSLELAGINRNAGLITVRQGALLVSSSANAGPEGVVLDGGTLRNAASAAEFSRPVVLDGDSSWEVASAGDVFTHTGELSTHLGVTLEKRGAGTLALNRDNPAFSGAIRVAAGVLRLEQRNAVGGAAITLEGNSILSLRPQGVSEVEVRGISGSPTSVIESAIAGATKTLVLNLATGDNVFEGTLRDGALEARLALRKTGAGTLILRPDGGNGGNTYTGATTVSEGILRASAPEAFHGTEKFFVTSDTSTAGTLDIQSFDYSAKAAEISGAGHDGKGAVADSSGGGTFPRLELAADAMIRTAGASMLPDVSAPNISPAAATPLLSLAPDAAPEASSSPRVFRLGAGGVSGVNLSILTGATLRLTGSDTLDRAIMIHLAGTGPAGETDSTLHLEDGVRQTIAGLTGNGSVSGSGTLTVTVPEGARQSFDGTLRGEVGLTLEGRGTFSLAPASGGNETSGVITVSGGTLELASMSTVGDHDVLGKRGPGGSKVEVHNGVLLFDNASVAATDRTILLAGTTSTFRSNGAGLTIQADALLAVADGSAHTLVLDGTASANVLAAALTNPLNGILSLRKTGSGTWVVGDATGTVSNTHTGGTAVQDGTLVLAADSALGISGTLVLGDAASNTSGILALNGHNQAFSSLTVEGSGANNRVINGSATGTATVTFELDGGAGNLVRFAGQLGERGNAAASDFSVIKSGTGTLELYLDPAHSNVQAFVHTGDTVVKAGTLRLSGATILASPRISIASGASLDVSGMAGDFGVSILAGQTLAAGGAHSAGHYDVNGNLTLNGGRLEVGQDGLPDAARVLNAAVPGSTLRVRSASEFLFHLTGNISNPGNSLLLVNDLRFDAPATLHVNRTEGTLAIGSYLLANYAGELANFDQLALPAGVDGGGYLDSRYKLALVHTPGVKSVYLNVTSTASAQNTITWVGDTREDGKNLWSPVVSNFRTSNGMRAGYFPGDSALFDDSAAGTNVTVGENVSIGFVTFKNDLDYTVSGLPIRGSGWLEKRGSGTLVLLSENEYEGLAGAPATYLASGTLAVGHDLALGRGALAITGPATLAAINGSRTLANDIFVDAGVTATFDSGAAPLLLTGGLSGTESSRIFKQGGGSLQLPPDGVNFKGTVDVRSGALRLASADYSAAIIALGDGSASIELLGGNAIGGLRGVAGSRITGTGTLSTGARGENSIFAGSLLGDFALRLDGNARTALVLSGDNSGHSGAVEILNGRLQIGDGLTGAAGTGAFTIGRAGRLTLHLPADATLEQPLSGAGFVEKLGDKSIEVTNANSGFSGDIRLSGGTFLLTGQGAFGSATIELQSGSLLLAKAGDYSLPNDISGAGELVKDAAAGSDIPSSVTWLGSGSVNIRVQSGEFHVGDGATVLQQRQLLSTTVKAGTALFLSPAAGGSITLGDLDGEAGSSVVKDGAGEATLTGFVNTRGRLVVDSGRLSIGDGTGGGAISLPGVISVPDAGGTLVFNRAGTVFVPGTLSSAGSIEVRGGEVVLQGAANAITGSLDILAGATVQVGDASSASLFNSGAAPLTVGIAQGALLRYTASAQRPGPGVPEDGTLTGASLRLRGEGVVEHLGTGVLRWNSDGSIFAGTFRAAQGTYVFQAGSLPPAATFDATGAGVLRIEGAAGLNTVEARFGNGDGTLLLAPGAGTAGGQAVFRLAGTAAAGSLQSGALSTAGIASTAAFANGTLAVASGATLEFAPGADALATRLLHVRDNAALTGAGTLAGSLQNDGELRPSGAGISVSGDIHHNGRLVVTVSGTPQSGDGGASLFRAPAISYGGTLFITENATLLLQTSGAIYESLRNGGEVQFLHDTSAGVDARPDISGAFQRDAISVDTGAGAVPTPALTYCKGDGYLTMTLSERILDIASIREGLHNGNTAFVEYLDATFREDSGRLSAVVSGLLNASSGAAKAINRASPVGLASATAMSLATAREDSTDLHSHLEASRYTRYQQKSIADTGFYISGTARFEQNTSADGPAWDSNIYGGTVGFDQAIGLNFLVGLAAGYHKGRATLDYEAGRVYQDHSRLTAYASTQIREDLYLDLAVRGGYSYYDIDHNSGRPAAASNAAAERIGSANPEGYDFGASITLGGAVGLAKTFSINPYLAAEYDYARVNAFTEKGSHGGLNNDAALHIDAFAQESLRLKVGASLNYLLPQEVIHSARLSLDVAYAHEFLDRETTLNGAFAVDSSGRGFSVHAPSLTRHRAQLSPSVDLGLTESLSFQFTYRFETDLSQQTAHHLNASLRLRF